MGLFSNNNASAQGERQKNSSAISSIISNEMQISGEVHFAGKARIDGTLEGDIRGEYLILSETGQIHGNLTLDTLVCHGSVQGDIQANTVTIHPTASIQGRLAADNLTVEPGAAIDGEIHAVNGTKPDGKSGQTAKQPAEDEQGASKASQADAKGETSK